MEFPIPYQEDLHIDQYGKAFSLAVYIDVYNFEMIHTKILRGYIRHFYRYISKATYYMVRVNFLQFLKKYITQFLRI